MHKKTFILLISFVLVTINLTGCSMPLPICSTDSLQQVALVSPAQISVVDSLNPTLQWTYPSAECTPEGYAITLWEGPVLVTNIGGGTGNPSTSWGPGSPLQPGKQYRWIVAPINGTTLGPASGTGIFFTGPSCTAASLVAPVQTQPADGASFVASELLWWDYTGGCTPTGYQVDISANSAFTGPNLGSSFDIPLTRLYPEESTFVNCETYYWRVAGLVGTTVGTFSPTRSFVYDNGAGCEGVVSPPASASISGIVWHDLCALPDGPLPDPLSVGCVADGAGSARANGIREAGEPGIPGVQVDLHWGGCATASVASVITDANGLYTFDGILAFGSYCVAVRSLNPPNDSILIPGAWTFPYGITGADAFANATVDVGTILTDKDFGWDYQFLPIAEAASEPPKFEFDKNAFCRKGPGVNYSDVTAIPAGDIVDILGISPDTQWYFIFWSKFNASCWIATSTGRPIGDLINITILTPAPTPVPTTVPSTKAPQPTAVPTATNQGKP